MDANLMHGHVSAVARQVDGDELTTDAAIGATVLPVIDVADFDEDGGWLQVGGVVYAYLGINDEASTITLAAPGLTAGAAAGEVVNVWNPETTGPVVELVATVVDETTDDVVHAVIAHELADRMADNVRGLVGESVICEEDADGVWVLSEVRGQVPLIDGAFIDPDSTIPPQALTDGLAPAAATVATFIGGLGSLFFRWTEVANADPVTYRLHVRAGSAPTTTGTYEVAAGVGLTSATVRKLKDGTTIVADGSVTYYGIVTVEDADGPGPVSNTASGVPAQVTSSDIAVNAITANLLTANDALIDALTVTDLTGVKLTGATLQTAETGARVVINTDDDNAIGGLKGYTGSANEIEPGILEFALMTATGITQAGWTVSAPDFQPPYSGATPGPIVPGVPHVYDRNDHAELSMIVQRLVNGSVVSYRAYTTLSGATELLLKTNRSGTGKILIGSDVRSWHENDAANPDYVPLRFISPTRITKALTVDGLIAGTMGAGSVGTGTFSDSVRAEARTQTDQPYVATRSTALNTITSTAFTGLNLSMQIEVASTTEVWALTVEPAVEINTAGTHNIIGIRVDGAGQPAPNNHTIDTKGPVGARLSSSKTWFLTGLTPGTRTLSCSSANNAAGGSATIYGINSRMHAIRIAR